MMELPEENGPTELVAEARNDEIDVYFRFRVPLENGSLKPLKRIRCSGVESKTPEEISDVVANECARGLYKAEKDTGIPLRIVVVPDLFAELNKAYSYRSCTASSVTQAVFHSCGDKWYESKNPTTYRPTKDGPVRMQPQPIGT